jgi:murein DD-endopeptidase MepM/ murein hydrolase activator NlpD
MRSLALLTALFVLVPAAPSFAAGDWGWPVRGQVLTEFRNGDDPYAAGQHRGVDIAAPVGTPVVAPVGGTVEFAGAVGSSGVVVSERTADGRYELSYLHLSSLAVRRGDSVGRGDRLGAVGVSGTRSAEAPHLHFGVREAGDRHAYLDPLTFLAPPPSEAPQPRAVPVPASEPVTASPQPAPVPVGAGAPAVSNVPVHVAHPTAPLSPAPAAHHVQPHRVPALVGSGPAAAPVHPAAPPHRSTPHHAARPTSGPVGAAAASAPPPTHVASAPVTPRHHGIDVGWLAACLGLVVAAALLAAPSNRAVLARLKRRTPPVGFDARWPTTSRPRSTT